jgi:hypothetical protein
MVASLVDFCCRDKFAGRGMGIPKNVGAGMITKLFFVTLAMFGLTNTIFAQDDSPNQKSDQRVIVVVGADGSEEYTEHFDLWANRWKSAAAHTKLTVIDNKDENSNDKTAIKNNCQEIASDDTVSEIWLVLIGHGTFDGKRAKFNLQGPDVDASELGAWLKPIKRRVVIVNCFSSSSPFINELSGENRIVVTATKSGYQYNFSRFGKYLSEAINDPAVDLDKDGQTSLLESFCAASESTAAFYEQEKRLATETSLLDDNGDGRGTPGNWFDGVRATRQPKKGIADGLAANQVFLQRRGGEATLSVENRTKRDELEKKLVLVRARKSKLDETQYLTQIEPIMIELAQLYAEQE